MLMLLLFALIAGLITVLSSCVLPVLPLLLSTGAAGGKYRPLGIISGVVLSFTFFTLFFSVVIHALGISPDIIRFIALGLIIFFGLLLVFPELNDFFTRYAAVLSRLGAIVEDKAPNTGFVGGCIVGAALGLIWAPCAGPILATVTSVVAAHEITFQIIAVTLAYSFGAALPMAIIAYGSNRLVTSTLSLAGYGERIRKIFGCLMILGALAIAFHIDVRIQQFFVGYFPAIRFEDRPFVRKELGTLMSTYMSDSLEQGIHAPDFIGITQWINSPPLSIKGLRGKVILVDFWTYSCINCVRTLPYLKRWYDAYKDSGFVIIGIHTPEFEFEKALSNVQDAVKRFGIEYPVALDNNYATWRSYANRYWPAHYLIDQQGVIRKVHVGEGDYQEMEQAIVSLLGISAQTNPELHLIRQVITPELYLGYDRAIYYQNDKLVHDAIADYAFSGDLESDRVGLSGKWFMAGEFIKSEAKDTRLDLNFLANRVYLVMHAERPSSITLLLDGRPIPLNYHTKDMDQGRIVVTVPRMYDLLDLGGSVGRHTLSLICPEGVSLYAFTFGAGIE